MEQDDRINPDPMLRPFIRHHSSRAANAINNASNTSNGVALLILGIALMSTMDAVAKLIVQSNIHVAQLLFIRSVFITIALCLTYACRKKLHLLKPHRTGAQWLRGTLGFLAPFCFFSALNYLTLTSTNVVFFSSTLMITVMSALLLKESVGIYRWSAVAFGYVGVFIAIDPQGSNSLIGYLLVLISSAAYAGLFISGKALGKTESSVSLVLHYNLGVGLVCLFWIPAVWVPLSLQDWTSILAFSTLAVFGQYCMTHAYALADASLLAPLDYTSLVWTLIFDLAIWGVMPSAQTMLGACIIILSSIVVIHRERVNRLARAADKRGSG